MGVKQLTDLAIDPATGDYVYTSLKLSDARTYLRRPERDEPSPAEGLPAPRKVYDKLYGEPKYTKINKLDVSNNQLGGDIEQEKAKVKAIFESMDTDGSGSVVREELKVAVTNGGQGLNQELLSFVFHQIEGSPGLDPDGDGKMTLGEFLKAFVAGAQHPSRAPKVSGLVEIPSLTDLNLASNNIGSVELPSLPVLQQLNLSSNLLAATPPLASLPSLTSLDLSSNLVVDLSTLGQAAKLTKLVLRGNALTSTKGIGACSSLRTLDVGANQLTSLDDLSTLVALATLNVSSNQLTTLAGIESLPSLTSLDAGANQLADVAAAAALASVETLRAITVAGGGGDEEGAPPPNPLCDADNLKVELLALRPTLVTVDGEALLNAEKEEASALRAERAEAAAAAAAAEAAAAEAAEEAGAAAE